MSGNQDWNTFEILGTSIIERMAGLSLGTPDIEIEPEQGDGKVKLQIGNIKVEDRRPEFSEGYAQRELQDIEYLVIHHSAVDIDSTAKSIHSYHHDVLGWPGIG